MRLLYVQQVSKVSKAVLGSSFPKNTVHTHVHTRIHIDDMCIYIYIHMHVYIYIYDMCTRIYIYTHIYMHKERDVRREGEREREPEREQTLYGSRRGLSKGFRGLL